MFNQLAWQVKLFGWTLLGFVAACGSGSDTAQWRGPDRNGFYSAEGLLTSWPDGGPPQVLHLEGIGRGHSTPLVYDDLIYTTGRKDTLEYLSAFNLEGELIYQVPFGRAWYKSYPDTRCTPTINDDRIYLISGSGEVACHDSKTGEQLWYVYADREYAGEIWVYGVSESVLLTDEAVIYTAGGDQNALVAFDQLTGELVWKSGSLGGARGYASHILVEHAGIPTIIAQTAQDVLGVDARNGEILWHHNLIDYHEIRMGKGNNINTPVYHEGSFYITSGYSHPGMLFEIGEDGRSVNLLWTNRELDCHLGGVILKDGYLYHSNWENNANGRWICAEWKSGEVQWEYDWYNKGSVISAEGLLYIYEEKSGHVGLLQPNPDHFDLISEFQVKEGEGPYWAHPSIYDGYLYLRHGESVLVYDLRKTE